MKYNNNSPCNLLDEGNTRLALSGTCLYTKLLSSMSWGFNILNFTYLNNGPVWTAVQYTKSRTGALSNHPIVQPFIQGIHIWMVKNSVSFLGNGELAREKMTDEEDTRSDEIADEDKRPATKKMAKRSKYMHVLVVKDCIAT
ncbi:hypothetical protein DM860_007759 [Cuscuta australis]|uniref:Uncharacterized protein n=1 Tax=Cuscuta australis TaxID=267555 RepID=A0A328DWI0_9ASTE|nr:hypothetical protein DM860_007759 [Cuscuta australis]